MSFVLTDLLDGGVTVSSKDEIDSRLVAWPLSFEPFKDVRVHAKRDYRLRRHWFQAASHNPTDNVLNCSLRVVFSLYSWVIG
jgi:hypothetical protein